MLKGHLTKAGLSGKVLVIDGETGRRRFSRRRWQPAGHQRDAGDGAPTSMTSSTTITLVLTKAGGFEKLEARFALPGGAN